MAFLSAVSVAYILLAEPLVRLFTSELAVVGAIALFRRGTWKKTRI